MTNTSTTVLPDAVDVLDATENKHADDFDASDVSLYVDALQEHATEKHDADFDAFASDVSLPVEAAHEATPVSNDPKVRSIANALDAPDLPDLDPELVVEEEDDDTSSPQDHHHKTRYVTPQDFELLKVIGMGAFGKVLQVRNKHSQQILAMKVISKRFLKRKTGYIENIKVERDIMTRIRHPFVVTMHCSFQTRDKLFIIMDFLAGGELFLRLGREGIFLEKQAAFYLAEIVLALDHLHTRGILHRDLKPENILLSKDGHVCLTDFGLAKDFGSGEQEDERASTICGTQEYMAPEMVARKGYGRAADYWSLGCIAYEMLNGLPPFISKQGSKVLFRKIMSEKVKMPPGSTAAACKLLKGLLNRNVSARLGAAKGTMFEVGGVAGLKQAAFFQHMDWDKLERQEIDPPHKLHVDNDEDLRHFHDEFTKMPLPRSVTEMSMDNSHPRRCDSDMFRGFSFVQHDFELPMRHSEEVERYWTHTEEDGESVSECASSKLGLDEALPEVVPEKKKRPPRKRKKKKPASSVSPHPSDNGEVASVKNETLKAAEDGEKGPNGGRTEDINAVGTSGIEKTETKPLQGEVETSKSNDVAKGKAITNGGSKSVGTSQPLLEKEIPKAAPKSPSPAPKPKHEEKWQAVGSSSGKKKSKNRNKPQQRSPTAANAGLPSRGARQQLTPDAKSVARTHATPVQQQTAYRPAPGSWAAKTSGVQKSVAQPLQQAISPQSAPQGNWAKSSPNKEPSSIRQPWGTNQSQSAASPVSPSGDWRKHKMIHQSSRSKLPQAPPLTDETTETTPWPSLGDFPAASGASSKPTTPKGAWATKKN